MRSVNYGLFLASVAQCASLKERGIPFRAPEVPEAPPVRPDFESPGSGGYRPGIGSDSPGTGGLTGGFAAEGTAPESTTPFQAGSPGSNKELIEKALEVAGDVFDLLQDVVDLATSGGGSDDSSSTSASHITNKWQPTSTLSQRVKPTSVGSTSDGASNATANYVITQNNATYTFLSDPRLMSKDVVAEMADGYLNRLSSYQDLFTSQEYSMFVNDPICFYANIESMYLSASSSIAAASATITSSSTQSLDRRQIYPSPTDDGATSCTDVHIGGDFQVCSAVAGSPEWSSSQGSSITALWATDLPDQLWSAHFATPTAVSGDVTATATSITTCAGLDGGEGPTTAYRELKTSDSSDGGASVTTLPESTSAGVRLYCCSPFVWAAGGAAMIGLYVL